MVDEVEYFIPLFTQTYDDLNQGNYSKYKQEVTMEFQSFSSNMADVFGLGSETIRQNKMREKIDAEYWYIVAKNREKIMQATITAPHSRALIQFLNFLTLILIFWVHNRALPEVLQSFIGVWNWIF